MNAQVTWSELSAALSIIVTLGGIVAGCVIWLWTKHALHDRELADFKIKVAENYVTLAALVRLEERFEAAMEKLGTKLERLMDKAASER
jgi:hypothetical protein